MDFGEAKTEQARVADEPEPAQVRFAIDPVASRSRPAVPARRFRDQADLLIVANGLDRKCPSGDFVSRMNRLAGAAS